MIRFRCARCPYVETHDPILQARRVCCPSCGQRHVFDGSRSRYVVEVDPPKVDPPPAPDKPDKATRQRFGGARRELAAAAVTFALDQSPAARSRLERAARTFASAEGEGPHTNGVLHHPR